MIFDTIILKFSKFLGILILYGASDFLLDTILYDNMNCTYTGFFKGNR